MKKLFLIPIILVAVLMSCSDDTIFGSGNLTSEIREVDYFSKVKSDGVFEITITQGATQSVEITGDNNIMNRIKTKVVNSELRLYLDDDNNYRDITLRVDIVVNRLNGIKNSGVGDIYAYNIDESGNFNVFNSGTANIFIEGEAQSLDIKNEGSGAFMGFNFEVNDGDLENIGSGDIEVNCTEELDVKIKGSGNVYYMGNPILDVSISGSGNVIQSNN